MSAEDHQTESLRSLPLQEVDIEFTRSPYSRTVDLAGETVYLDIFINLCDFPLPLYRKHIFMVHLKVAKSQFVVMTPCHSDDFNAN